MLHAAVHDICIMYMSQVLERTRAEMLPLVEALHNLFFPLASNLQGATGRLYRTNVSSEEFLGALASWYALISKLNLPRAWLRGFAHCPCDVGKLTCDVLLALPGCSQGHPGPGHPAEQAQPL